MIEYSFTILGAPVGQGNLSPVPRRAGTDSQGKAIYDWRRPRLVHQNAKALHPWRQEAASVALSARETRPLIERDLAVSLSAVFYFARPKSLHRLFTRHTKSTDIDRLLRALADALTGVVWADDAQLDEVHVWKRYAGGALDPLGAQGTPRTVVRVMAQEEAHPKDAPLFLEELDNISDAELRRRDREADARWGAATKIKARKTSAKKAIRPEVGF